jgi:hypothetical protein
MHLPGPELCLQQMRGQGISTCQGHRAVVFPSAVPPPVAKPGGCRISSLRETFFKRMAGASKKMWRVRAKPRVRPGCRGRLLAWPAPRLAGGTQQPWGPCCVGCTQLPWLPWWKWLCLSYCWANHAECPWSVSQTSAATCW